MLIATRSGTSFGADILSLVLPGAVPTLDGFADPVTDAGSYVPAGTGSLKKAIRAWTGTEVRHQVFGGADVCRCISGKTDATRRSGEVRLMIDDTTPRSGLDP